MHNNTSFFLSFKFTRERWRNVRQRDERKKQLLQWAITSNRNQKKRRTGARKEEKSHMRGWEQVLLFSFLNRYSYRNKETQKYCNNIRYFYGMMIQIRQLSMYNVPQVPVPVWLSYEYNLDGNPKNTRTNSFDALLTYRSLRWGGIIYGVRVFMTYAHMNCHKRRMI